tara:strand:- start:175 stop:315 length:141 start_codon:yes stop_codon:yes gene_type:complete
MTTSHERLMPPTYQCNDSKKSRNKGFSKIYDRRKPQKSDLGGKPIQ